MNRYRCLQKIRDFYVIQNEKTLEIELVYKNDYIDGKKYELLYDYDLISEITRLLLCNKEEEKIIIFSTNTYIIYREMGYDNKPYYVLYINDDYINEKSLKCYIPSMVDKLEFDRKVDKNYYITTELVLVWKGKYITFECRNKGSKIKTLDLSFFDSSEMIDMEGMFSNLGSLVHICFNNFNTSRCQYMQRMFSNDSNLEELDLSSFDTSEVRIMNEMFDSCMSLSNINLSSFNTERVVYMKEMFLECSNLKELDVSSFDTSKVRSMNYMFAFCNNLRELDLHNFSTNKVLEMKGMFANCDNLTKIDMSGFCLFFVENMNKIFLGVPLERLYINLDLFKVESDNIKVWDEKLDDLFKYLFHSIYEGARTIRVNDEKIMIKQLLEHMVSDIDYDLRSKQINKFFSGGI